MSVPEFKDLSFYSDPNANVKRYQTLEQTFRSLYGTAPDFVARSPGRVNLIGEHIDYCYFSVLPMAVDVDVAIAVQVVANSNKVVLNNIDNEKFTASTFELPHGGNLIQIDASLFSWANYFKCGLLVAHQFIQEKSGFTTHLNGMNILVHGTVPSGGGLSSSAAFVCASALAVLEANNVKISKQDLTRITVVSEHYIGVNTGGMDQCASVCGEKGHALYVEFKPSLKATPFKFPETDPKLVFVIANTLVTANKHETAPKNYNLRVVEVCLAAEVLAHRFGLDLTQDSNLSTGSLRGFQDAYFTATEGLPAWDGGIQEGCRRLKKMVQIVEEVLVKQEGYTTEEAAVALGSTVEELKKRFFKFPVVYDKLQVYKRARHAYSEALRVLESLVLLQSTAKSDVTNSLEFFGQLGELMNQSQASCRDYFECSCDEIERICDIALENGSYGSRLTGAGWGGFTVNLTTSDEVDQLKKALVDGYYKVKFPEITDEQLEEAIVVSNPAVGSSIIRFA